MQEKINKMPREYQPTIPSGPDPKWRYMWRVGPRPSITSFKVLVSPSHLFVKLLYIFFGILHTSM